MTPGKIELQLPDGWNAQPLTTDFQLTAGGEDTYSFVITPPSEFKGVKEVGVSVKLGNAVVTSTKVQVASGGIYLSDISWIKATAGWAAVQKDKSTDKTRFHYSERQDRLRIKGIGTHSKSEITYDISNATYKRFNSYVESTRNLAVKVVQSCSKYYLMGLKYLIAVQCTIIRQQNLLMLTLQVKRIKTSR